MTPAAGAKITNGRSPASSSAATAHPESVRLATLIVRAISASSSPSDDKRGRRHQQPEIAPPQRILHGSGCYG